jgi:hypothetical protein
MKNRFPSSDAWRDHLLSGEASSLLEGMAMFGVCNPAAELTKLRKEGFIVKSERVLMTRIMVRMNKHMQFVPPAQLPHKECYMQQYWIER